MEKQPFFFFAVIFVIHIFIGGAISAYLLQNTQATHIQNMVYFDKYIETGLYITIYLNDFIIIHMLLYHMRRVIFV